jgi:organic radical activating enzyme
MKKITKSCRFLQRAIYFGTDELRHCCKRFFHNGKMKGDVPIFSLKKNLDVSLDRIIKAKKNLINKINSNEETGCTGCPVLEKAIWKDVKDEKFDHISIEHHAKCNMRCSYCSEIYYGGKVAKYDIFQALNQLVNEDKIRDDCQVAWGGGEPTMSPNFKELVSFINNEIKPKTQRFFSNAINYSEEIANLLKNNIASLTTSVDAGSIKTFKKVRGVNQYIKVLKNLKKYHDVSKKNTVIKFIFTENNSTMEEIENFVHDVNEYGLSDGNFLISSNFKDENLTLNQANLIIYLHTLLINNGSFTCALDDHVRPRINKISKQILHDKTYLKFNSPQINGTFDKIRDIKNNLSQIIVWGIGEYANLLLDNSLTFSDTKVKFFVDSNPHKQGTIFRKLKVLNPSEIHKHNDPILIASSFWYHEIYESLISNGVEKSRIYSSSLI